MQKTTRPDDGNRPARRREPSAPRDLPTPGAGLACEKSARRGAGQSIAQQVSGAAEKFQGADCRGAQKKDRPEIQSARRIPRGETGCEGVPDMRCYSPSPARLIAERATQASPLRERVFLFGHDHEDRIQPGDLEQSFYARLKVAEKDLPPALRSF